MIETREVKIAKEINDVMDLVVEIIKMVKTKGDYSAILDDLIPAIEGVSDISAEVKEDIAACINTVGGRAGDIIAPFINTEK